MTDKRDCQKLSDSVNSPDSLLYVGTTVLRVVRALPGLPSKPTPPTDAR
jgi:hypothetical protein